MMIRENMFPIQGSLQKNYLPSHVPWWLAEEAYLEYSRLYGKDQTLERLAERGGFSRNELLMFLRRKTEWVEKKRGE